MDRVDDEGWWADSVWCGGNEEECRTGLAGRWVTESARRGQAVDRHGHRTSKASDLPLFSSDHNNSPRPPTTMPVAPITGTLRKKFFLNLSVALGLGTAAGYTFWYVRLRASFDSLLTCL